MPLVSVIVPTYNESLHIENCLQSLLMQCDVPYPMEILVVDGDSKDDTPLKVEQMASEHASIRLLHNPKRIAPCAMNIGIRAAQGDYIVRVDAHAAYPSCYVSTLIRYMEQHPEAANVGVCCRTLPAADTPLCRAIATACSHRFGVGDSSFRTGTASVKEVDTVPFGCWRREWFDEVGLFDEELVRNQDDEFNARTIEHGGRIFLLPHLVVDYYARETLGKMWHMFYQYGLFKPLVNRKLNHPATLRQFVPPLFVATLPLSIWPYLLLCLYIALSERNSRLIPAFLTMHMAYGCGYWMGLFKIFTNRPFSVESKR